MAIDAEKLGGGVNAALIKQAYVRYHANRRVGTSKTLNRHNVEGSTRKITSRRALATRATATARSRFAAARTRTTRARARGLSPDMPKKMRQGQPERAALKLVDNEVRVIDSISMSAPKTKDFVEFLSAIKAPRSALIAVNAENQNVRKSGRNVEKVTLTNPSQLNCFDMLNHRYLVITKADLEAYLAGPSSQTGKDAKTNPLGRKPKEAA